MNTKLILFLVLSVFIASPAFSQTCTVSGQDALNTCIGDAIDTCHASAELGCVRQVQEASDTLGLALEDCCCNAGEPVSGVAEFDVCKTAKRRAFRKARSLFSGGFRDEVKASLRDMTFADCTFGCDF